MPSFIVPEESNYIPPGVHRLEVVEAVDKVSKSGNEMIEIKLQSEAGGTIRDFLVFSTKAAFKLRQFLEAAGKKLQTGERINLTSEQCMELKPMWAIIGPDEDRPQYMKVRKYLKPDQVASAKAEFEAASKIPSDEGDEIPF